MCNTPRSMLLHLQIWEDIDESEFWLFQRGFRRPPAPHRSGTTVNGARTLPHWIASVHVKLRAVSTRTFMHTLLLHQQRGGEWLLCATMTVTISPGIVCVSGMSKYFSPLESNNNSHGNGSTLLAWAACVPHGLKALLSKMTWKRVKISMIIPCCNTFRYTPKSTRGVR